MWPCQNELHHLAASKLLPGRCIPCFEILTALEVCLLCDPSACPARGGSHLAGAPPVQLCCTLSPRGGAAGLAEVVPSQGLPVTLITPDGVPCLRGGSDHCSTGVPVKPQVLSRGINLSQTLESMWQTGPCDCSCASRCFEVGASTRCTGGTSRLRENLPAPDTRLALPGANAGAAVLGPLTGAPAEQDAAELSIVAAAHGSHHRQHRPCCAAILRVLHVQMASTACQLTCPALWCWHPPPCADSSPGAARRGGL